MQTSKRFEGRIQDFKQTGSEKWMNQNLDLGDNCFILISNFFAGKSNDCVRRTNGTMQG